MCCWGGEWCKGRFEGVLGDMIRISDDLGEDVRTRTADCVNTSSNYSYLYYVWTEFLEAICEWHNITQERT